MELDTNFEKLMKGQYGSRSAEEVRAEVDEESPHSAPETKEKMVVDILGNDQYEARCAAAQKDRDEGLITEGEAHFIMACLSPQYKNPARHELAWQD